MAKFALLFAAVTVWIPAGAAGTMYAQELKLPLASALQDVETLPPSTVKVMVPCGTKPRPLIAAPLPTAPALGVRLMAAGLTVKAWPG